MEDTDISHTAARIIEKTVSDPVSKDIAHHLRAMGHYFELDEKKVKFYIEQLKLSGKI